MKAFLGFSALALVGAFIVGTAACTITTSSSGDGGTSGTGNDSGSNEDTGTIGSGGGDGGITKTDGGSCSVSVDVDPPACKSCVEAKCCTQLEACGANTECGQYASQVGACTDQTCVDDLTATYPVGAPIYDKVAECAGTSCKTECE